MNVNEVLLDLFGRVSEHVHEAVDDIDAALLNAPPKDGTNPIGWLIWHLTRVEDSHIAELLDGAEQLWVTGGFAHGFGVEPDPDNSGYGHTPEQVAMIKPDSVAAVVDYYDAVAARTNAYLRGLTAGDLDRVVDRNWDPPVTLGVRLISVADDEIQHSGQACYLRGLLERD